MQITCDGVSHRYRQRTALDAISFALEARVTGIIGANGAGKSTLLNILSGAQQPTQGTVTCDATPLYGKARRSLLPQIALMPQVYSFPGELSVLEFVSHLAWMRGVPKKNCIANAHEAIEQVQLSDRAQQRMGSLSGGMVRRVGLAQALVAHPKLLILDEPTTGLDPEQRAVLRQIISDIPGGAKVIISSHIMEDIENVAERVMVLDRGRLLCHEDLPTFQARAKAAVGTSAAEAAFWPLFQKVGVSAVSNSESQSYSGQDNFPQSRSSSFSLRELFDLSALSAKARMAVLMLPSLGIIMLVGLFSRGMFWDGEWAVAIDWVNGITIIMGPILTGLCAYEIQRIAGPDWRKLARQTQRPGALALRKMLVCWLWGCGVWAAGQITALVICATQGTAGWFPWKALVFGPITIFFYVTYGALIGTLLPRVIAGPIAAVSIFGIFYLGAGKFIPAVLTVGGFTASLVGQTWDPIFAALTILILSTGGIGLGLLALVHIGERFRGWPVMICGLLLTAIVGGVLLENSGTSRIMVTSGPVEVRCAGAIAKTCLPINDSTRLSELARLIDANAKALIAVGATPPKNFAIDIPGRKPARGTAIISLNSGDLRGIAADPGIAADFMATPTPCSAYTNPNATMKELPETVFQSRILIGAWLRKQTELEQVDVGLSADDLNKWLSSPERNQNAWVKETYAQLKNCELTKVSMPFKVGAF